MTRAPTTRRRKPPDKGPRARGGFITSWRSWLLALLLAGGVVVAALHWGDVKKFAGLVAQAKPGWLLVALLAQLGTYLALAIQWAIVLRAGKCPWPIRKLLGLTVAKHFADQTVPTAGMSGNVVVVDRLVTIGASKGVAVAAVILTIIGDYASYAVAAVIALLMLWLWGTTSWLIVSLVVVFLGVAAGIPSFSLWLQKKGRRALPAWVQKIGSIRELFDMIGKAPAKLVRDPWLIGEQALLNGAVFALDGWTLQLCLFALGVHAWFSAAFAAFMIASMVVVLGPIPMGLGSFEAVCIGILRVMHVPFEAALSATLLFRGFTLWVPLLPGMIASRRLLKSKS